MQIVLDTNVLVSGLLSATGPPGRIVEAALAGHLQLVFDMAIRREYEDVLRRPELALPAGRVDDLVRDHRRIRPASGGGTVMVDRAARSERRDVPRGCGSDRERPCDR